MTRVLRPEADGARPDIDVVDRSTEAARVEGSGPTAPSTTRAGTGKQVAARRAGYVANAVVDGVLLWVTGRLLGWGWPPFLTDAFDDLLPFIRLSLGATVAVNVLWVWRDPDWFRHLGQVALNVIGVVVVVESWRIFPLDFTSYWSGWETLARVALGVAFFGLIVDSVARLASLAQLAARHGDADHRGGRER